MGQITATGRTSKMEFVVGHAGFPKRATMLLFLSFSMKESRGYNFYGYHLEFYIVNLKIKGQSETHHTFI